MAAITNLDTLVNKMSGGSSGTPETLWGVKYPYVAGSGSSSSTNQDYPFDRWDRQGIPGPGTVPTSVAAPTSSTQGAIPFTNASGGRRKFVTSLGVSGPLGGSGFWVLYDRLLHISGLDATVTSAQTIGGTITRYTGGEGNQIWITCYTTAGSTDRDFTASYTNQDGTSGRTTQIVGVGGNEHLERAIKILPLQAGDTGVRSVQSVTFASALGSAGDYGVVIAHPLMSTHSRYTTGMFDCTYPVIEDNACLAFMSEGGANSQATTFTISTVEA